MKFKTDISSLYFTPFRYNRGCWWEFLRKMFRKKGEQAAIITLWAWIWLSSSQARVTSKKSFSSRISLKAELTFDSKSFHRRQNFSDEAIRLVFCWFLAAGTEKCRLKWLNFSSRWPEELNTWTRLFQAGAVLCLLIRTVQWSGLKSDPAQCNGGNTTVSGS